MGLWTVAPLLWGADGPNLKYEVIQFISWPASGL